MESINHAGGIESTGAETSYIDHAGAYMDYDGAAYAQFGAKGPGSLGVKIRSVLAGVALTLMTFASGGAATHHYNVTMDAGTTFAAQAVTATTVVTSSNIALTTGDVVFATTARGLRSDTNTKFVSINGGSTINQTSTGATINLFGNSHASSAGKLQLVMGSDAGANMIAYRGDGATAGWTLTTAGVFTIGSGFSATAAGAITGMTSGAFSGAVTTASVSVSGGGSGQGKLWYNAADGLVLQGKTGSGNDFSLYTPASGYIMTVPTGTNNVSFAATTASTSSTTGAVIIGGGLGVAGRLSPGSNIYWTGYGNAIGVSGGTQIAFAGGTGDLNITLASSNFRLLLSGSPVFSVNSISGNITQASGTASLQAVTATTLNASSTGTYGGLIQTTTSSGAGSGQILLRVNNTSGTTGSVISFAEGGTDKLYIGKDVNAGTTNNYDIYTATAGVRIWTATALAVTFSATQIATFTSDLIAPGSVTFGGTQLRADVAGAGGVQIGAPTGGFKGTGTINVATDIYKNNTAYTNPDYALEWWATGGIKKFRKNPGAIEYEKRGGRLSLAELEGYVRKEFHLPGVPLAMGSFERHDVLLEKVEELATYIIEQQHEINSLKARLA